MKTTNAPVLQTQRLMIKRLQLTNAEAMFHYRADERVSRYQDWRPSSCEEVQHFIEKNAYHDFAVPNTWFQLGIYIKESEELIGDIGLHFLKKTSRSAEIGYTIAPDHQRRGYAFESVKRVLAYLFDTLHMEQILAAVMPGNNASISLLTKLGAKETKLSEIQALIHYEEGDHLFVLNKQDQ